MIIMSVNLDGKLISLIKLVENIKRINPIIIALQDLPALRDNNLDRIIGNKIQGYTIATNNENTSKLRYKTVVLFKEEHCHLETIKNIDTDRVSGQAISINIPNLQKHSVCLINAYIRPRATQTEVQRLLDWIQTTNRELKAGNSNTIICADVNAEDSLWAVVDSSKLNFNEYTRIKINRGKQIARAFRDMKMNNLNPNIRQGGSYTGIDGHQSYIDILMGGQKIIRRHIRSWFQDIGLPRLTTKPIMGHKIICVKLRGTKTNQTNNQTKTRTYINYKRLNEEMFLPLQIITDPIIKRMETILQKADPITGQQRSILQQNMDQLTDILYTQLIGIQNQITEQRKVQHRGRIQGSFNAITIKQIRKLKRLESSRIKSNQNRRKTHKLRSKIIQNICTKNFRDTLYSTKELSLWDTAKAIMTYEQNIHAKRGIPEQLTKTKESALTTEQLNKLVAEKFPPVHRQSKDFILEQEEMGITEPTIITHKEIDTAINNSKKKRYTGPDGIKYPTLINTITYTKRIVYTICKLSFYLNKVPKVCQNTLGTIIPKKKPGTFRIVHVGSPLTNILEQIALHRLEHALEINRLYNTNQYGFIANRGRQDLIAKIIAKSSQCNKMGQSHAPAIIIGLDIEGAFDNVDQDGMIDKLWKELWPNPIRHWIANYVTNRNIRIKYMDTVSQTAEVCRGVPQGSPLGPILWNYTINTIDLGLNNDKTEILAYADDLIIACYDNQLEQLQLTLDKLVERLASIKLRIRADKCSIMQLSSKHYHRPDLRLYINQDLIPNVKVTNILGVRINQAGKLDKTDETTLQKIQAATHKLRALYRMNIIYKPNHWRTLIEAHLSSIIQLNNVILMSTDRNAIEWADKTMAKAIRTIFGWPCNTSHKLTRLITGTKLSKFLAVKTYKCKETSEHYRDYEMLSQLIGIKNIEQPNQQDRALIENMKSILDHPTRKYYDPQLNFETNRFSVVTDLKIAWIITERSDMATATQIIIEPMQILRQIKGRHSVYPISYFNAMSLIWTIADDKSIVDRQLLISENNSILMALKNETGKHDWRVIQLRDKLVKNNWRVFETDTHTMGNLKTQIHLIQLDNTEPNPTLQINTPNVTDYYIKNKHNKVIRLMQDESSKQNHTTITSIICSNTRAWAKLSPSWVSAKTMLMLSGLYSVNGRLEHGEESNQPMPRDCTIRGDCRFMYSKYDSTHPTIHRANNCIRFTIERQNLHNIICGDRESIDSEKIIEGLAGAMEETHKRQKILRILTDAAFPV